MKTASEGSSEGGSSKLGAIYDQITGDEDARVCKDIPEAACNHQPRNFFSYLIANFLGKVADELASARLVIPWLLGVVGAPAAFVGFIVPIREAGVLLPQLAVAAYIRRLPVRKGVWVVGALLSAVALGFMALTAVSLDGVVAGWAVIVMVTLFSLSRGLCSVSAKDVLGKTVSKTRRGVLMGYSAAAAGVMTLLIGIGVEYAGDRVQGRELFLAFMVAAAALWVLAAAVFASIREVPGATEGGGNAILAALSNLALLKTDRVFRQFVVARALLLSAALAPPFYVLLAQQQGEGSAGLGLLVVASGLASSLSAPIWGRMGDRSSRRVMVIASACAGATGLLTWLLDSMGAQLMQNSFTYAFLFLLISIFHSGVRLGRKIYLVDMASQVTRSAYVAVSNTVVGVLMLIGGAFGILADLSGITTAIAVLGVVSLSAAIYVVKMKDVSG